MNLKSKEFKLLISDIEFRSERRDKYLPVYEDLGYLTKLENNKNQIIFGRRGSGKTHLLGGFVEYINKKNRNIAVYVDLKKLTNDIIDNNVNDFEKKSFLYFWAIMKEILTELRSEINRRLTSNSLSKFKKEKLIDAISSIDSTLRNISSNNLSTKTGDLVNDSLDKSIGGFSKEETPEEIEEESIKIMIRRLIGKIGANYLIVGLDEWSSLRLDVQPRLANMLNKEFFTSNKISFKIATIKFRTQFYILSKNIGLELGADIFSDIDLDISQMWERGLDASINFFRGMIIKHLNYSIKKLNLGLNKITEKTILDVFTSDKAFIELVKASEGIPRDFLNIFRRSYDYFINGPSAKTISIRHIKKAVADWYQEDKISALVATSKPYLLLERLINEVIIRYRIKQFILPSAESGSKEIQQLVDLRLLHLLKQGWSSKRTPGKRFDIFSIDYGAFISILETKIGKEVRQIWSGDDPLPEVNLRNIRRKEFNIKEPATKRRTRKISQEDLRQATLPLFKL